MKHIVPHPGPPPTLSRGIHFARLLGVDSPYSFPSGHLLRTTFLAALIAGRAPHYAAIALWAVVAVMAVTRIYLAEHWPSDVVGGFLLGWVLARLAVRLREPR
jgi:membrane-associated phospholipid phosphatase